eukprot:TRINITY_DN1607_c0_g1_i1.p1 TRINITY_DN1607_c0_g1~~TRINITY_DN1607_c0_g1_i1.p1  ORF type:complete len:214 (+),score=15.37 TRINITY_DN1607_c0_g1_i1:696-1337(+)
MISLLEPCALCTTLIAQSRCVDCVFYLLSDPNYSLIGLLLNRMNLHNDAVEFLPLYQLSQPIQSDTIIAALYSRFDKLVMGRSSIIKCLVTALSYVKSRSSDADWPRLDNSPLSCYHKLRLHCSRTHVGLAMSKQVAASDEDRATPEMSVATAGAPPLGAVAAAVVPLAAAEVSSVAAAVNASLAAMSMSAEMTQPRAKILEAPEEELALSES